jgi:hypothetical protein
VVRPPWNAMFVFQFLRAKSHIAAFKSAWMVHKAVSVNVRPSKKGRTMLKIRRAMLSDLLRYALITQFDWWKMLRA